MGYVFDFKDAKSLQRWYEDPRNGLAADIQNRLMLDLIRPRAGETLIEIGCGTGMSLRPFIKKGLSVTGLDPSPYMLDIAKENLGAKADLHRGFAEDLPFDDNSFNHACFMTTLEFVEDPVKAITEAGRIAKDKLFIGVLNRYALKGFERRLRGVFTETIYNRARFYSVWELKQMLKSVFGEVPVDWRTVNHLPTVPGRFLGSFGKSAIVQKLPFGTFAGVMVPLMPRFRTRPLNLKYRAKPTIKPVAG